MRTKQVLAFLAVALLSSAATAIISAQTGKPTAAFNQCGRYQVILGPNQPMPILLDTETGNVWVPNTQEKHVIWKLQERSDSTPFQDAAEWQKAYDKAAEMLKEKP